MSLSHALATIPHTLPALARDAAPIIRTLEHVPLMRTLGRIPLAIAKAPRAVDAAIAAVSFLPFLRKKRSSGNSSMRTNYRQSAIDARQGRSDGRRGRYTRETETTHRVREIYDD